jgi:predicted TIM-barrel fold metal-dependent hydrolase
MKFARYTLAVFILTSPLFAYDFNDSHFHLTNYIQEGITPQQFLQIMGDRVGRSTLFGIPLQQQWSYRVSADKAPKYYLDTDSPLYYYSFTDAAIAQAYLKLTPKQRDRFDPMITGFNPTDMYAADHIRRVLQTFPGVFTGIGEFTIHKEFVSSKVSGDVGSLTDPALDRILDFAAESGLVVILHSDVDKPMAKPGSDPLYLAQMKDLFKRHPKTSLIWAHTGMGRVVRPITGHAAMLESLITDAAYSRVNFDISWDEVAKYIVATPESLRIAAELFNKYPDRFLFGSDTVAPTTPEMYFKAFEMYQPLWQKLTPEAREKIQKGNYLRLFDDGRRKVRAWEKAHATEK